MQQCPEQGRGGRSRRYQQLVSHGRPQSAGASLGRTGHDRGRSSTGQGVYNLSQVSVLEAEPRITATHPGVPGKRDFVSPVRLSRITEEGGWGDSTVAIAVRVRPFSKR